VFAAHGGLSSNKGVLQADAIACAAVCGTAIPLQWYINGFNTNLMFRAELLVATLFFAFAQGRGQKKR